MRLAQFLCLAFFMTSFFTVHAQTIYNSNTFHQFNTPTGYINLGTNQNQALIDTDRSSFSFNKSINTITGTFGSSGKKSNLYFQTAGTTRMFVRSTDGYVGIGTTSPKAQLHVEGSVLVPNGNKLMLGGITSQNLMRISSSAIYNINNFDFKGNLNFRRVTASAGGNQGASMTLQKDGTVTIGIWEKYDGTVVDTDGHKLMVNGGILCERLKIIEDVPNSDHVFESDYALMPLNDLKTFITTKKHLPEVPSAKEFQENGYNVGQMDDLLLRKVEELTLYILQLEEKIQRMEQ